MINQIEQCRYVLGFGLLELYGVVDEQTLGDLLSSEGHHEGNLRALDRPLQFIVEFGLILPWVEITHVMHELNLLALRLLHLFQVPHCKHRNARIGPLNPGLVLVDFHLNALTLSRLALLLQVLNLVALIPTVIYLVLHVLGSHDD